MALFFERIRTRFEKKAIIFEVLHKQKAENIVLVSY